MNIEIQKDILAARQLARKWSVEVGFGLVDQTKVTTAVSEIARNTLDYGGGGEMQILLIKDPLGRTGLRLVFEDHGPGIESVPLALSDGFTTGGGMGMGLPGAKRLMSEFNLETEVGKGTRVTITKWK